jgi:hypothetical protein
MLATEKLVLVDINVFGIGSMRQWAYSGMTFDGNPTGAIHDSNGGACSASAGAFTSAGLASGCRATA